MKRQYITKSGDTWEWDETPQVLKAVKQLHKTIKKNETMGHTKKN